MLRINQWNYKRLRELRTKIYKLYYLVLLIYFTWNDIVHSLMNRVQHIRTLS